jgi:hypothetical protein
MKEAVHHFSNEIEECCGEKKKGNEEFIYPEPERQDPEREREAEEYTETEKCLFLEKSHASAV